MVGTHDSSRLAERGLGVPYALLVCGTIVQLRFCVDIMVRSRLLVMGSKMAVVLYPLLLRYGRWKWD